VRKKNLGFSLLEAIVALVILSAGLMAAYSWFDRGLDALVRMDRLSLEESVVQETIERLHLKKLNTGQSGQFEWQDYLVQWTAELYEPIRKGVSSVGSYSYFDQSLYRINLLLAYKNKPLGRYAFFMQEESLERPPPRE